MVTQKTGNRILDNDRKLGQIFFSFNSTFRGDGSTLSLFVTCFTFSLATVYQITLLLILADTSRHRLKFIYSTSSDSKLLRQAGV